ncbi:FxsA family protein [Pseudomonas massiliensis]|uniref:FxsA family protein n=1 Tax=Pseudomonas massiliensis TaxID=522492 RepID=UPI00058DE6CC|nr:FxsA family protein [Pseudomonas massiliensis]
MRLLLLLLLLFPVLELYVFFRVGSAIGFFPALLLIIAGSAIGVLVLRVAGLATALNARASLRAGQLPAQDLLNGAMVASGGLLLVVPGFISDVLGLLCLLPFTRRLIANRLRAGAQARYGQAGHFGEPGSHSPFGHGAQGGPEQPRRPNVIEGQYERRD